MGDDTRIEVDDESGPRPSLVAIDGSGAVGKSMRPSTAQSDRSADSMFERERQSNGGLRGLSLRVVILGGLVVVVLTTLFGVSLSVLQLMRESAERERRQAAEVLAIAGLGAQGPLSDERVAASGELRLDDADTPTLGTLGPDVLGPLLDEFETELDADALPASDSWLVRADGERWVVAAASVDGERAFVVVLSLASFDARIASAQSLVLLYLALVGLAVLALGYWFLTRTVVRPVRRLMDATERVAAGDLSTRVRVGGVGEIASLSERFDTMVRRVRDETEQRESSLLALAHANTDLREANQRLERARDELVRSERLATIGQLSAGIAHEIGNPLASIRAYVDLLRDEPDLDDEVQGWLRTMRDATDRVDRIIRELLDYSRVDDGERFPVHPRVPIEHAVHLLAPQKRLRGVTLDTEVPDAIAPVPMHESAVVQILVNGVLNAADALATRTSTDDASPPRVIVRCRDTDDAVHIEVADNGPGIPDEVLAHAFDPFFTTKRQGEGTGLGLAISERLAARMGARLELDTSDVGTTLALVIPRGSSHVHENDAEDAG